MLMLAVETNSHFNEHIYHRLHVREERMNIYIFCFPAETEEPQKTHNHVKKHKRKTFEGKFM